MSAISRRAFALGAGSLPILGAAQSFGQDDERNDTRVAIIDCSEDTRLWIDKLKKQGVRVVVRYLGRAWQSIAPHKRITCNGNDYKCDRNYPGEGRSEAQQLLDHFALLLVYQYNSSNPAKFLFGLGPGGTPQIGPPSTNHLAKAREEADKDADAAEKQAAAIGKPPESPIYFGLDFDLRPGSGRVTDLHGNPVNYDNGTPVRNDTAVMACEAYFGRLKERFGTERLGVYGNGFASQRLQDAHVIKYSWISESRSFYRTALFLRKGPWHLFQHQVDRHWFADAKTCPSGLELDGNVQNPDVEDIGAWNRSGRFLINADRTKAIFGKRVVAKRDAQLHSEMDEKNPIKQRMICRNRVWVNANKVDRNRSARVISEHGRWLYIEPEDEGRFAEDERRFAAYALRADFVDSIKEMPDYWLDGRDQ